MKIAALFARRPPKCLNSKVLVCSLGPAAGVLDYDAAVYSRHYKGVNVAAYAAVSDLVESVEDGYDIVHLFCPLASGGLLIDSHGKTLTGSELIQRCCEGNVKLLWVANENRPEDYVKGFRAKGKRLNLIMTINRNGDGFGQFLEKLLGRISNGETLPVAWATLVPQSDGPCQQHLPGCIFFAGRGDVQLLP